MRLMVLAKHKDTFLVISVGLCIWCVDVFFTRYTLALYFFTDTMELKLPIGLKVLHHVFGQKKDRSGGILL